jgi:hypothetical protein
MAGVVGVLHESAQNRAIRVVATDILRPGHSATGQCCQQPQHGLERGFPIAMPPLAPPTLKHAIFLIAMKLSPLRVDVWDCEICAVGEGPGILLF